MDIATKPTTCHKPIVGMEGGFKREGNYKVAKPTKTCLTSYNMGDAWVFWSVMEMCWQGKMIKIEIVDLLILPYSKLCWYNNVRKHPIICLCKHVKTSILIGRNWSIGCLL